MPVSGVGETGLRVGHAGEIEGHDQGGDGDVGLGEGPDTAFAEEGLGGEVGAVGEVEDCGWGAMGISGGGQELEGLGCRGGEVEGGFLEGGRLAFGGERGEGAE